MGCLYQLAFPNGKNYIGMTVSDPRKRILEHNYNAKNGSSLAVAQAIRKFGREAVQFKVLVIAKGRDYLAQLERNAIRVFGTRKPNGYNLTDGGDGAPVGNLFNLGKKRSPEVRLKMSLAMKGKKKSAEGRANIARANAARAQSIGDRRRGIRLSEDTKAKMSAAHTGKVFSPEHLKNISRAAFAREAAKRAKREAHGR